MGDNADTRPVGTIWRNACGDIIIKHGGNLGEDRAYARYKFVEFCGPPNPAPISVNAAGNMCQLVGDDEWAVLCFGARE